MSQDLTSMVFLRWEMRKRQNPKGKKLINMHLACKYDWTSGMKGRTIFTYTYAQYTFEY
jgi:hypothetical protein